MWCPDLRSSQYRVLVYPPPRSLCSDVTGINGSKTPGAVVLHCIEGGEESGHILFTPPTHPHPKHPHIANYFLKRNQSQPYTSSMLCKFIFSTFFTVMQVDVKPTKQSCPWSESESVSHCTLWSYQRCFT